MLSLFIYFCRIPPSIQTAATRASTPATAAALPPASPPATIATQRPAAAPSTMVSSPMATASIIKTRQNTDQARLVPAATRVAAAEAAATRAAAAALGSRLRRQASSWGRATRRPRTSNWVPPPTRQPSPPTNLISQVYRCFLCPI